MRCHQQKTNVPTNQPISCSTALSSLARWNSEAPDSRSSQRVVGGEGDGDLDEVDGDRAHTTRAHAAIPGLARCAPAPKRLLQRPSWRAWEERDRTWSQSDEVRFYHGHAPDGGVALALTKATPHALFARLISRPKSAPGYTHASLSLTYLRRASRKRYRLDCAALRLVPSHPRPWRGAFHRSARPLRAHSSRRRSRQQGLQTCRGVAFGMGGADRRQGAPAARRYRESGPADRSGRSVYRRNRGPWSRGRTADAGFRRAGISRGDQAQISLPRSAARASARKHHVARQGHRFDPPAHEGIRVLRISDAYSYGIIAGRRARLSRALASAPRKILRAAAGTAAIQAADHGRRFRPLLPDRTMLP